MKKRTPHKAKAGLRPVMLAGAAAVLLLVGMGVVFMPRSQKVSTPPSGPLSRQVMAYAEQLVIAHKEPPTLAALHYAYIASAYDDALHNGSQTDALFAARDITNVLFADKKDATNQAFQKLADDNHVPGYSAASHVTKQAAAVILTYSERYASDGHDLKWDGVIPTGTGKWTKTAAAPATPRAGDWKRWVVTKPIEAPAPPAPGSAEDARQLNSVQRAVAGRNGEDVNKINFWAGSIGTETPSGIWQNQLFATIKNALPADAKSADAQYALVQKNVAQTMSDAFMECWKVKYTYWTARPDQRLPGLQTGMPDPPFPSYISGHSTVSKAAADALSIMVPQYKDTWESMAVEARNSRLVAGIHFDIDNAVGFDVGTEVVRQSSTALNLQPVL
jgi:hypothetical protein